MTYQYLFLNNLELIPGTFFILRDMNKEEDS